MKIMTLGSAAPLGCLLLAALTLLSCSHERDRAGANGLSTRASYVSASKAAQLAAQLANDECERRYHRRPFRPEQHAAVLDNGKYRWGGLDVGGRGGFSALVTFEPDGSHPKIEVYFSTDTF